MLLIPKSPQISRPSRRLQQNNYQKYIQKEYINLHDHDDLEFTILVLKKEDKAKQELQYLMRAFSSMKFFEEKSAMLEQSVYQQLFKKIKYQRVERDHSVFNYGEEGETYFIILRGSVTVLLPKPDLLKNLQDRVITFQQLTKQIFNQKEFFKKRVKTYSKRASSFTNIIHRSLAHDQDPNSFNGKFNRKNCRTSYLHRASMISSALLPESYQKQLILEDLNEDYDLSQEDEQYSRRFSNASIKSNESQENDEQIFYDEYLNFVYSDFDRTKELTRGDVFGEIALVTKSKRTATIICQKDCDFITLTKQSFDSILGEYENLIINQQVQFFKQYDFFQKIPNIKLVSLVHQMVVISPKLHNTIYKENDEADKVYFIYKGEVEISKEVDLTGYEKLVLNKPKSIPNFASQTIQKKRQLVSMLTQGSVFGHEEILSDKVRITKAVCKSFDTTIYTLNANIFISQLNIYSSINSFKQWMMRQNLQRVQRINLNKQATEIVKLEQTRMSQPRISLENNNTNVKQKYEEMTRFKMGSDAKLLCDAKQVIEDKLKSIVGPYDSVMIPVCNSKYLNSLNNKRPRQQQNFITPSRDTEKFDSTNETHVFNNLDRINYYNARFTTNHTVITPQAEQIERESSTGSKYGLIGSLLSPQERQLLDKEKLATNYEKFHTKDKRNNFLCQYSLLGNKDRQQAKFYSPNNSFVSRLKSFNLSQPMISHKTQNSIPKFDLQNEVNIHVPKSTMKRINKAMQIVQSMGFK